MARTTQRKLSRQERSELTRAQLIESAAQMVGDFGYDGASISRICTHAGIAQGTFYNYFESRQEIFNLLPVYYGEIMLKYIRENLPSDLRGLDREVARLAAFFDFYNQHNVSERIISEAPIMAVEGHRQFYTMISEGYRRAIDRDIEAGYIRKMSEIDLRSLVDMLIAIRNGLSQPILVEGPKNEADRGALLALYRDIIGKSVYA